MSRGRYLTNTNLDDLRRRDSFELQAATLDRYDFIDVVYQDFFYNFDDSLSFEEIEKFGFKSDLPIITPHNLLKFNSPHNGPMWRKSLHAELGLFDTQLQVGRRLGVLVEVSFERKELPQDQHTSRRLFPESTGHFNATGYARSRGGPAHSAFLQR